VAAFKPFISLDPREVTMQRTFSTVTSFTTALTALLPVLIYSSPAVAREKAAPAKKAVRIPLRRTTPDPRTVALLKRVKAAYRRTNTLTADFTYSVTSVKRQQVIEGTIRMKRPNLARVTFSFLREPAFPNLVASDGKKYYTFTPESFDTSTRRFQPLPFDSQEGAKQASGLLPGGGAISESAVSPGGTELHLWDATPIQAFFDPFEAIRDTLFIADPNFLEYEGTQKIGGVTYRVLRHYYPNGNIAGGESSPFRQRLYIGPDDLIHQYVLEFVSGGRPGVQVARLSNIRLNPPINDASFAFTPNEQRQ
jgi:outer membrane lipoprotein-sorting protein